MSEFSLNDEDLLLSDDELLLKLAFEIVENLHPAVAKRRFLLYEIDKMRKDRDYFVKNYKIYLMKRSR